MCTVLLFLHLLGPQCGIVAMWHSSLRTLQNPRSPRQSCLILSKASDALEISSRRNTSLLPQHSTLDSWAAQEMDLIRFRNGLFEQAGRQAALGK